MPGGSVASKRPGKLAIEIHLCCEDDVAATDVGTTGTPSFASGSLMHCANTSAPPLETPSLPGRKKRRASSRDLVGKPLILVMQLATQNLWTSFCRHSAAINAAWAQLRGHRYLVTPGDYLDMSDVWRGGNVRAIIEVNDRAPEEVEWLFHLDCDAALVDFSGSDALASAIHEFAGNRTEVILSRDESGFAGTSRLTNMGTGLWRRSAWTSQFLKLFWSELLADSSRTEQEVLEGLLKQNAMECLERIALLPAGRLNSESANPISAPPRQQPVVHLAGMPNKVRGAVFRKVWLDVCRHRGMQQPDPDGWSLRELMLRKLQVYVESLPDEPPRAGKDWTQLSAPCRNARRLALALLRGGREREGATRFFGLALKRGVALEAAHGANRAYAHAIAGFMESLAGPLIELGRSSEAQNLLLRPWPAVAAGSRHAMDELIRAENLCTVFQSKGQLLEAETYARKALTGLEEAFPASSRDIRPAGARARLAHVLHSRGLAAEAEPLLRSALRGYEDSLGLDHPETLGCARNLAVLLKQMPQTRLPAVLPEADALLRRAAQGYAARLGAEHPETQRAERNLANFKRWWEARERKLRLDL